MRTRATSVALAALLLSACAEPPAAGAQTLVNPDFEDSDASGVRPRGWHTGSPGYVVRLDSQQVRSGAVSLRIEKTGAGQFAAVMQQLPGILLRGSTLRFSGYIRTEEVVDGWAGLWMRVDGAEQTETLAFDNMQETGPRGTTDWTRYTIELPVGREALGVALGMLHSGGGRSWFDSLSLEVTRAAPAPAAAAQRGAWVEWIRRNHHPLREEGDDFADLRFLAPLLEGKRLVQLGESGHGVAEFNQARVRLIKYLHQELGYDVVAFESGLFECFHADQRAASLSAQELMRSCIFGVWHSDEALELFEYIRATHRTARPLRLAGFDVQVSGMGVEARPAFLRDALRPFDAAYADAVHARDSAALAIRRARLQADSAHRMSAAAYDSIAMFLRAQLARVPAGDAEQTAVLKVAAQVAWSAAEYVRMQAARPPASLLIRDSAMARNVDFLLDELYPDARIINWGHNSHLRHRGSVVAPHRLKMMGEWLAARRKGEMYTVGLYMGAGRAAHNNRDVYDVAKLPEGGMEWLLDQAGAERLFVDFSRQSRVPGNTWIFEQLPTKAWGIEDELLVPAQQYDGVLFIRTVRPPRYR